MRQNAPLLFSTYPFVFPLLTGTLLGLSFPPYSFSVLAWVALVPLLLRWSVVARPGWMLAEAYAGLAVACAIAFYWVLLHDMASAALASLGGLLIFPLLLALPFAASVPLRKRWGDNVGVLSLVAFYLSVEWGLSHGPLAFPWPLLGHTQATTDPFRQIADLAGVPGLSAWVLSLNGFVFAALRPTPPLARGASALASALLIASAGWYGAEQLDAAPQASSETQAVLVQPALPPAAWADVTSTARVDTLLRLSTTALEDTTAAPVQLVIWPETALLTLSDSSAQQALYDRLQRWTEQHRVALLTGAIEPAFGPRDKRGVYFNSALLIRPHSLQRYRKNYLVPFAEHVPFSEYVPALRSLNVPAGGVAGYRRGTRQPTLLDSTFQAGALICFESTFSHYVRGYVDPQQNTRPVDFLVTLAQDGWWGRSPGYRQHLAFSQLRAIETRRAMAFVTVTGTTALIDAHGHVQTFLGWMERGTRRVIIPHTTGLSGYVRYGDWLSMLALALSAGFGLAGLTLRYMRRRKTRSYPGYYNS